jgi:antitoxin component of MazEF toxin-antitoxin module
MPYIKQLSKLGNSAALIIDRPFLDQLNLAPGAQVEVSVEANALVVRPHRYATDEEFTRAAGDVARRRRGLMKKLVNR